MRPWGWRGFCKECLLVVLKGEKVGPVRAVEGRESMGREHVCTRLYYSHFSKHNRWVSHAFFWHGNHFRGTCKGWQDSQLCASDISPGRTAQPWPIAWLLKLYPVQFQLFEWFSFSSCPITVLSSSCRTPPHKWLQSTPGWIRGLRPDA